MLSYHPDSLTVDIVGIVASNCGRNCDDHPFCGEIVKLDVVVRFCREMIHVAFRKELIWYNPVEYPQNTIFNSYAALIHS
jgi:hypothetical protein